MKSSRLMNAIEVVLLLVVGSGNSPAQSQSPDRSPSHPRYKLIDLGTLGGPNSTTESWAETINRHGLAIGSADTPMANPSFSNPNPFFSTDGQTDPYVIHSFRWDRGQLQELESLPGADNNADTWINASGVVSGTSETGADDPLMGGVPATAPVIWTRDRVINLGSFGGNQGVAWSINDRNQVAGMATNTIPDANPDPGFGVPFGAQVKAFLWEHGVLRDLGTLGGPSAVPFDINEQGEIAGVSYTSFENGSLGTPPVHPFLWDPNHGMQDLGTLGGEFALQFYLNNHGWVVGAASLAENPTACFRVGTPGCHAFLWRPGNQSMEDLGTLGGGYSDGLGVDDSGAVVGSSTTAGDRTQRAFRWKDGHMTNLGSLNGDPCSRAFSSNSKGQVVGISLSDCNDTGDAFLWEGNGPMIDLNALIPSGSGLLLHEPAFISEAGEIIGKALLPNGDAHVFLLIPEEGNRTFTSADSPSALDGRKPVERVLSPELVSAMHMQRAPRRQSLSSRR